MTNARHKVMFVIETMNIGGAERQLAELLRGLDRENFDPCLVCFDFSAGFSDDVAAFGVPIFYALRKWRWDPLVVLKLLRLIREHQISLLHTYMPLAGIYGSIAARIADIPIINSAIRGSGVPTLYQRMLLEPSFAFSNMVLANSEAGKQAFNGLAPHKIRVVYNGIDLKRFNKLADPLHKKNDLNLERFKYIVSLVARLEPVKNLMMFISVAAIVLKDERNIAFLVIGDGSLKKELELQIRNMGLETNVFLLGSRNDVEEILQITDVGVLTSDMEGLPNAVIEMLASGVPVVATNRGGTAEVLDEGQTGFCVERDDELGMARKILELLKDETVRKTMGSKGKQVARERFSLKTMIETIERIYWELLR